MSQQAAMTSQTAGKTPAYAWVVLFAIYMATLAAPLNQMKVPPVLPVVKEIFGLDYSSAGMLMSIFSIMGFVLAIPAGFILQKIGIKITGLIAVGAVMVGSGLGALADGSGLLFFGRFIEGAGMGLIMVAAPAAISVWFPAAKRGLPMGLWASCVGVGSIVSLNLAPALLQLYGWSAVWWAGAIIAAAAFLLFAVLFRMPRAGENYEIPVQGSAGTEAEKPPSLTRAMANSSLWLLSFTFMCFNLVVMAWSTFYPDFLNTVRGYTLAQASFITSLIMMVAIFFGPLGGYISDRMGSRKKLIIVPFALMALLLLFPFSVTGWMIPAVMILTGIFLGPVAPVLLAAVPEVMKSPALVGIGLGVVALGQNLGMFIGPTLFGRLVEVTSWPIACYILIPISILAVIAAWMAKIR